MCGLNAGVNVEGLPTLTLCWLAHISTCWLAHTPLQEHKFWEDSFRVYERGVAVFKYPHAKDIWQAYLKHFVTRYGGTKLERARDLFEQASPATSHAMSAAAVAAVAAAVTPVARVCPDARAERLLRVCAHSHASVCPSCRR